MEQETPLPRNEQSCVQWVESMKIKYMNECVVLHTCVISRVNNSDNFYMYNAQFQGATKGVYSRAVSACTNCSELVLAVYQSPHCGFSDSASDR